MNESEKNDDIFPPLLHQFEIEDSSLKKYQFKQNFIFLLALLVNYYTDAVVDKLILTQ